MVVTYNSFLVVDLTFKKADISMSFSSLVLKSAVTYVLNVGSGKQIFTPEGSCGL